MKTIRIDITHIHTVKALHVYLAYVLDLPAYYGRNLDALHDMLTQESERTQMIVCGAASSGEIEAYLPRLMRVLEDSAQENEMLRVDRI